MKFFDLFKSYKADVDDIHEHIDKWHEATTSETVHEYLGMSEEEYGVFIRHPEEAEKFRSSSIVNALKKILKF
jgi:hypothetical protein